jgi:hypothetical protein
MAALKTWAAGMSVAAVTGLTQASPIPLQGRDINGNPVAATDPSAVFEYDANLNLTWLRDWNYVVTSGYAAAHAGGSGSNLVDISGAMGWNAATAWASNLTVGSFGGWSLPTIDAGDTNCDQVIPARNGFPDQHYGANCTGSAPGYLFYTELGNIASADPGYQYNLGPFQNVDRWYWSSTDFAPLPDRIAWGFYNWGNYQTGFSKTTGAAWAEIVRSGDVATAVPEPQTLALVLMALGGGWVVRRRQPRR